METAEQKIIKAFVVNFVKKHDYNVDFTKDNWELHLHAIRCLIPNEDLDLLEACKEYLDQFTDTSKKVDECDEIEPTWKPEVGKLYKRNDTGTVIEFEKKKDEYVAINVETGDISLCVDIDEIGNAKKDYQITPIAELEGLEESDSIWCIAGSGVTEYYTIESVFSHNLTAYCGKGYVSVYFDGSACMFGNGTQLFWRTADRAERLGRK